jgi:hypothetical protein
MSALSELRKLLASPAPKQQSRRKGESAARELERKLRAGDKARKKSSKKKFL